MTRAAVTRLGDERGFSMVAVMMVLAVASLFTLGAFAAADGDLPLARESQDRKVAYAAAEGGINLYQYHLNQDNEYWTKCTAVPAPNATELNPVNDRWDLTGADPRRWRTVPGSEGSYAIELLPAPGYSMCQTGDARSMIDGGTGVFRIRATGRARGVTRSVITSFRRVSFLDFLYFTDYETLDPVTYPTTAEQTWAATNCAKYRALRPSGCTRIRFVTADAIRGPLHTNDDLLVCGSPTFGRDENDSIEMSGGGAPPAAGFLGWQADSGCSGSAPVFNGIRRAPWQSVTMPTTNAELKSVALAAYTYTGETTIRFNADGTMTVTNGGVTQSNIATPANGVIYVKNGVCGASNPPINTTYNDPAGCANVYVSGTYTTSLTVASEDDIIIRPPTGSANGDLLRSGDAVMGLIANNFVRVYHRVNNCQDVNTAAHPRMGNVRIDAAILSLTHSFIVDNYRCGSPLGTLTVNGAIAQKFRGPVGTGSGSSPSTGYIKDYGYDDRLRFRSPPFFLNPVAAAWHVVRTNEQVPAAE